MDHHVVPTLVAVALVSLVSLVGAATLSMRGLQRHGVLITLVALAAGALLGDAIIHLLPETVEAWGGLPVRASLTMLGGFGAFFALEAAFRWRHAHAEIHHDDHGHIQPFGWLNLIGDGIHNVLDGVLIAGAFLVDPALGLATTIAVGAHEIPQELGDFAVLLKSGLAPGRALAYNFGSALLSFLGAGVVLVSPVDQDVIARYMLPAIAGGFLYIAAADLVPELHHHSSKRHLPLIVGGLVAGVALMAALLVFE